MRKRPIIFDAESVRAILDGRKTQTRRIVKPQPPKDAKGAEPLGGLWWLYNRPNRKGKHNGGTKVGPSIRCPFGEPGDLLWVRETWAKHQCAEDRVYRPGDGHLWGSPIFKATKQGGMKPECEGFGPWRSPIHMPSWASRLTLRVTDVRVERVQCITGEDILAEGYRQREDASLTGIEWMMRRWDSTYSKRAPWASNPWVWALTFEVQHA